MKKELQNTIEQSNKNRLTRYGNEDILNHICRALPTDQQEPFRRYRELWQETDKNRTDLPFPLNIYIEPVSHCNLKCSFCVRSRQQWRNHAPNLFSGQHLGLELFQQIIDEGAQYNLPAIWVGASGEALLEKKIPDMMRYAHDLGILDNILITNGSLLTHELIDNFLSIPLTRLNISIDAATAETYSNVRGADHDRLLDNLHYLLKQRSSLNLQLPVVRVTFVETEKNRHERDDFISYWSNLVETVDIQKYYDFDLLDNPDNKERDILCSFPWRSVMILANGDVIPCCSFYGAAELIMGNIRERSLKSIWDGELFTTFREEMKNGLYRDACKMCFDAIYSG